MTHTLPKDRNSYGLIHGDAHPWNLLLHKGNIILTDFDFCEYNWFVSDIAVALFYALMAPIEGMDKISFARCFMENFMSGYGKANNIEAYWMKQIATFLRLRMASKYVLHYQEWRSDNMSERRNVAFMEWKYKIENDIPYIDMDFSEFS
jgi:Ser/Thr protein kinase RdoA (MazF antagonist)